MIFGNRTPSESMKNFKEINVEPFRDSSPSKNVSSLITVINCLEGLDYAIKLKWYEHTKFNLEEYQFYSKPENGDMNWIIPGKFLACKSPDTLPNDCCVSLGDCCGSIDKSKYRPPDFYIPVFRKLGIKHIIRLNEQVYNKNEFIDAGFEFTDLGFPDGTAPPRVKLRRKQ